MDRTLKLSIGSLAFNIAFATYYLVMGLVINSWWLLTLGSYYLVLSLVRFMVLRSKSKESFIAKFTRVDAGTDTAIHTTCWNSYTLGSAR